MQSKKIFNILSQFLLPAFTLGGQLAIALKAPQLGLVLNLLAQPFWLYSSWQAFKQAGQLGMLVNTIVFTIITAFGIVNYWL
jgi:hypothetical protein